MNRVPIVLAGFGQWAQNCTVVPLLKRYGGALNIAAVTAVSQEYYDRQIVPLFEENNWPMPPLIESFRESCDRQAYSSNSPAAMVINSPNAYHFEQAKLALKSGMHVYVERPIATHKDHLPELISFADRHNLLLYTGTQRRHEAPFKYLYDAVKQNNQFGTLKHIRCRLSVHQSLSGWRCKAAVATGGIVIDSGYHLIDIAAWLAVAAGMPISESIDGAAHFDYVATGAHGPEKLEVETEAVGRLELPNDILLSFDFSYNAPKNSILEEIEICDHRCTNIKLTRAQAVRTSLPGTITHQMADGRFATIESADAAQGVRAEAVRFTDQAQQTKPLHLFLEAVGGERAADKDINAARHSVATWCIVREIYRLAQRKSTK